MNEHTIVSTSSHQPYQLLQSWLILYVYRFTRSEWAVKSEKSLNIPPGHMASLREVIEKAKTYVAQSERNEAWRKQCRGSNSVSI